jgi:anti-sigma regulatory factor (Ser/Thr protein kinase)
MVAGSGHSTPSPDSVRPGEHVADDNQMPLPLPGRTDWQITLTSQYDLPKLRGRLHGWARLHRFGPAGTGDVVLAVSEIATNGLVHGQLPVYVHGWRDEDALIVQADDHGGIPLPAAAGRRPPAAPPDDHYGLWVARQIADVMQTHTTAAVTSVRLCFRRYPGGHGPGGRMASNGGPQHDDSV